jgi:hypothetical protein
MRHPRVRGIGWKGASFGLLVPLRGIAAAEKLWTRNLAGALHTGVVRSMLTVSREMKTEIPVCTLHSLSLTSYVILWEGLSHEEM